MPAPVKRPVPALYEGRSAQIRSLVLAGGAKKWFDPCSAERRNTPNVAVTGSSLPGIGQPIYHEHRREWEQYAFDTREKARRGTGRASRTAVAQSELEVVRVAPAELPLGAIRAWNVVGGGGLEPPTSSV